MISINHIPLLVLLISFSWIVIQSALGFLNFGISERFIRVGMNIYCSVIFILNAIVFFELLKNGTSLSLSLPDWFSLPGFRLTSTFYIDLNGSIFTLISSFIFLIISKFSYSYLHRDDGFYRYFILISILSLGVQFVCYAGSLDLIVIGWELVGITSVHLIAFFQSNMRSVQNSFRALVYYKLCDMSLLCACILLHYYDHGTEFSILQGHASEDLSHWIGLLIIMGTLAKSAQFPLSNWLFRALEGPTTSSAIFYGALSVHLGPFLLMRTESIWMNCFPLRVAIFCIGMTSAVYSTLVGRTRGDIKSSLAYSTIIQIGIIYMELAMGLNTLAMIHIVTHALMRTWQFLRSSSAIQDFLESAVTREQFQIVMNNPEKFTPAWKKNLYVHALNGFYLDALHDTVFVKPFKTWVGVIKKYKYVVVGATAVGVILSLDPALRVHIHALVWMILIASMLFSLIGFSEKPVQAIVCIVISQILFSYTGVLLGGFGKFSTHLFFSNLILIAPIFIYLIAQIQKQMGSCKEAFLGLNKKVPRMSHVLLVLGWLLVGIPGGPVQLSEDLLFEKFMEISPWTTVLFLFCSFFNVLVFYRQYTHIFYGPGDKYKIHSSDTRLIKDLSPSHYFLIGIVILYLFLMGLFPKIFILTR